MMGTVLECCANCWRSSRTIGNVSKGLGMNSSVSAMRVHFDQDSMWVDLSDGRILAVPLAWFPRLLHATAEERERVRISSRGLHWEALDEDVSVAGLLAGMGDQNDKPKNSRRLKRLLSSPTRQRPQLLHHPGGPRKTPGPAHGRDSAHSCRKARRGLTRISVPSSAACSAHPSRFPA